MTQVQPPPEDLYRLVLQGSFGGLLVMCLWYCRSLILGILPDLYHAALITGRFGILCGIVGFIGVGYFYFEKKFLGAYDEAKSQRELDRQIQSEADRDEVLAKLKEEATSGVHMKGWLTIRRVFDPKDPHASIAIYELPGTEGPSGENGTSTPGSAHATQTSVSRIVSLVQNMTAKEESKGMRWCVLKGSVLFVYSGEDEKDVSAALDLSQYVVRIEKRDGEFKGKDGEMFGKRSQIALRLKNGEKHGLPILVKGMDSDGRNSRQLEQRPIYISVKSSFMKEDWYLAFLAVSSECPDYLDVWSPLGMRASVNMIETEPDPTGSRALAAVVCRLFFGYHKTAFLEQVIIDKIHKKLDKLKPEFPDSIQDLKVEEFNVGGTAPMISNVSLKEHTPDGKVVVQCHISVKPAPGVADSAKVKGTAKVRIPTLGVYNVMVIGHLRSIEGDIEIEFKPPPSNRFWWGFITTPTMDYSIQPVVSKKVSLDYSFMTNFLDRLIKRAMAETCILPNKDDIAFFDTSAYATRGAIFSHMARNYSPHAAQEADTEHAPVDMTTSAEDPASATVDSSVRRRAPTKSQTTDVIREHGDGISLGIPRTDTAPAGLSTQIKRDVRKSGLSGSWTPSILDHRPASTDGVARSLATEAGASGLSINSTPAVSRTASDDASTTLTKRDPSPSQLTTGGQPELSTLRPASPAPFIHPTDKSQPSPTSANAETASIASTSTTASSIFSSLRAGDKKALQGQMNATRDRFSSGFKKWRDTHRPPGEQGYPLAKDVPKPTAVDQSPKETEPAPRRSLDQKSMTLQERLAAAAAASAGSSATTANLSRARSNTASSKGSINGTGKPALLSHPSKSGAPPVESTASASTVSPPSSTLLEPSPVIGEPVPSSTASGSGSASGSKSGSNEQSRRSSNGSLTLKQPKAVKGVIILPSAGDAPEDAVRQASGEADDILLSKSVGSSTSQTPAPPPMADAPPLPPRKNIDEDDVDTAIPPPLPPRNVSPGPEIPFAAAAGTTASLGEDLELKRPDSAPPATTSPPVDSVHSPPKPSPPPLPPRLVDADLEALTKPLSGQETPEEAKGDLASAIEADVAAPPAAPSGILVDVSPSKSSPSSSPSKTHLSQNGTSSPLSSSPGSSAEEALRKLASRNEVKRTTAHEPPSPSAAADETTSL